MPQSRKEFFTQGLAAFGRELIRTINGSAAAQSAGEVVCKGTMILDNSRCLAQRGGCFSCLDRCPREAIGIRPGIGILVDEEKCDGCGECSGACPIDPPAFGNCSAAGKLPEEKGV